MSAMGLLWLASKTGVIAVVFLGIIYSFVLLMNYALIHEAAHDLLHSNARINYLLGTMLGWFFPISFTVLKVTHIVHHCCNRTDHEMFDCYYQGDNLIIKTIQWYGLLLGLWWPLIPVGTLLLMLAPRLLVSAPFRKARSTAVLFDDFGRREIWRIRWEVIGGILFWAALYNMLQLSWIVLFFFYICFAFNWSTRQYVTHAFTPRNVRDGALNLKVSKLMGWLLLNGHWDLVHHQNPHISWYYLESLGEHSQKPVSYWGQYIRMWKGPLLCNEKGPEILPKAVYQSM